MIIAPRDSPRLSRGSYLIAKPRDHGYPRGASGCLRLTRGATWASAACGYSRLLLFLLVDYDFLTGRSITLLDFFLHYSFPLITSLS